MLHPPHVPLDAAWGCQDPEIMVGRGENDRQQPQHFAKAAQFVQSVHFCKHLTNNPGTFGPESQRSGRVDDSRQPVAQFGKQLHAPLHERMAESRHQITDMPIVVCRIRLVDPAVKHAGRDQYHICPPKKAVTYLPLSGSRTRGRRNTVPMHRGGAVWLRSLSRPAGR